MKIVWARRALEDLIEIERYIAKDSQQTAIQFTDHIIERCENLKDHPGMGRIVPEISSPKIRELIIKNYRIVYQYTAVEIQILTVFEGHRLLPLK